MLLFENQTTNGPSKPISHRVSNATEIGILLVWGTFDGAVIELEHQAVANDPQSWVPIARLSRDSRGVPFHAPPGPLRVVLYDAGERTKLNASIKV